MNHLLRCLKTRAPMEHPLKQQQKPRSNRWSSQVEPRNDLQLMADVVANIAFTQEWISGLQDAIRLANRNECEITNGQIELDCGENVTSISDVELADHVSNHYVVTHASWNSALATNESFSIGIVAWLGTSISTTGNELV